MLKDKIEKYEKKGREKFKKLCDDLNLLYVESDNLTEHFDGIVFFKNKKYIIEIKDRSNKFNYDTILFEQEKYDNLKKAINENEADGAYYISIWNTTIYAYLLPDEIDVQTQEVMCNKCTAKNDSKRKKTVYFIPKEKTKIYKLKI